MTDQIQREILPIPDQAYAGLITYDAKDPDTAFPPIEPLRPPARAPNVLVILLDDVGFAASSAFGGPVSTPTAERLAADGLKYNRFHTTALCSPTRQAMLTGSEARRERRPGADDRGPARPLGDARRTVRPSNQITTGLRESTTSFPSL